MPLYEYLCKSCGRLEVLRRFSDPPLTVCDRCGRSLKKLLSSPAVKFKGSGWYVNDYARPSAEGKKEAANAEGGGEGRAESGGEGKAEGKAESGGTGTGEGAAAAPPTAQPSAPRPAVPTPSRKSKGAGKPSSE